MNHLESDARKELEDAGKLRERERLDPDEPQSVARRAPLDCPRRRPNQRGALSWGARTFCFRLPGERARSPGFPRRACGGALGGKAASNVGEGVGWDRKQASRLARRMRAQRSRGLDEDR